MKTKEIIVMDGMKELKVSMDAARFAQFESLAHRDSVKSILGDASEGMGFLVSQLAYTEAKAFARQYTPMQYERLVPLSSEAGEWAEVIRYQMYDQVGQGKRISGKDRAIPKVDVSDADKTMPVYLGGVGYDYSQEELRRAAHLKSPLPTRKLGAAIEAYRRHINTVALTGEAISGITGLFNNASVPHASAPTGSWGGGTTTEAQVLADLNTAIMKVWENSGYNDFPTHLVLPPSSFAYLVTTPRGTQSDSTLLKFILDNNMAKLQGGVNVVIEPGIGLETAGAGNTKRLVAYVKNEDRVVMHLPMPLRFLAPQPVGLMIDIVGEYKYSGVEVRYPNSMYYMDGL